jgi:predicted lipoprotein
MRLAYDTSGLGGRLAADSAWIAQSIGFEFDQGDAFLGLAAGPIAEVLEDGNRRGALVTARLITSHLSELFGVNLAGELGLSAGFSSLDGD